MKICIDGIVRDMTEEEIAQAQAQYEQAEKEHWKNVDYGEAINSEIRKKYTESEEFAILRQKDEKQQEYVEYYEYCERCKTFVKKQKAKYEEDAE
jgi:hypothetical protein